MPQNIDNEPGLAPSADSRAKNSEKVRAGKGVAGIRGGVAGVFLAAFVVIIVGSLLLGFHII